MKFNVAAFLGTIALVIVSGIISSIEGTLTAKRVTMGFLNHGGMWGDFLIMSTVAGLVTPHLAKQERVIVLAFVAAFVIAIFLHASWAKAMADEGVSGHMFPNHKTGKWYLDISGAGWAHVLVMTGLLAMVFLYAASPVPTGVIIIVSLLLTIHILIAAVQPGWYCTGVLWRWRNFGPPLVAAAAIWFVAILKIEFTKSGSGTI
jgi:hypothetical protein